MIRYLENEEKQNIRPLYEQCFHDGKEYTDFYFDKRLSKNLVVVNEKEGETVSALHLIPKKAVIGALKTDLLYIYGVGTQELYRHNGYMSEIFGKVLKDMFSEMEPFTYLIPSDEGNAELYRKLGFEYVMDKGDMKPEENRKKATHSLMLRKADNSDLVRLAIFAQSSMGKNHKVFLVKDIDYFRKMQELIDIEGGRIEIYVENKVVVGYRIWLDNEIFEEVLDPEIQSLSWLEHTAKPYAMARILNIRKTLRMLGFKGTQQVIIRVHDPVIPENDGYFKVTSRRGDIKLERLDETKLEQEPQFDITISELAAHIFGYKKIEGFPEICELGSFFINDYV